MLKLKTFLCVALAAACAAAAGMKMFSAVPAVSQNDGIALPIVMYHSVLKNTELSGKYIITPDCFINDIKYLKEHGYTSISMRRLIDYVDNGTPLPEKPVMLTFDDGSYNNYEYVLPILEEYDEHAIFCIVGKYTDDCTETNEANPAYGYMRWIDVYNMYSNSHAEIANHSYDFHKYSEGRNGSKKNKWENPEKYKEIFRKDTLKLQNGCLSRLKFAPIIYAYPFGAYSKESLDVLKELGFRSSLTCNEGVNIITRNPDDLFFLKRYNRPNDISSQAFFSKMLE